MASLSVQVISNLAHIPEYALLTFLWLKSFTETKLGKNYFTVTSLILAGLLLFAISDEFHQSFVPGRTSSYADIGLDAIGVFLGFAVFKLKLHCFSSLSSVSDEKENSTDPVSFGQTTEK
jgi:VanZ family protein